MDILSLKRQLLPMRGVFSDDSEGGGWGSYGGGGDYGGYTTGSMTNRVSTGGYGSGWSADYANPTFSQATVTPTSGLPAGVSDSVRNAQAAVDSGVLSKADLDAAINGMPSGLSSQAMAMIGGLIAGPLGTIAASAIAKAF